ncbi:MAG: thiamine-phosphate kinase [Desulfarculaceae bacterium]|nr:thiamine-phosphate kinase [Desulfarculaceae bacterium]MCF8074266.1 thiamine-phosphate kinase [Desulfarculaceae bacterium]MCF8102975.1 thiamine-phosphate kinase [Desulfarculaceae bacterium]MCF8117106.1 thiamine-phosphate kinase [Desulfarculaceae bacterium]
MAPENTPPALSEEEIIRLIATLAGEGGGDLAVGIGDDAAVLGGPAKGLVVTTDLLVEGSHFDLGFMGPAAVGWRAMAANLSDLAGMGAQPAWGFLSLGLKAGPSPRFVEELAGAMVDLGQEHGLVLAGGDTVRSPQLIINLCLMGRMGGAAPLLRSGGRPGDAVCVTGGLGGSAAGLAWLQAGRDPDQQGPARAVAAFTRPQPRLAAGRALAQSGRVHAMMDLSDGLASDLARLTRASGLGAKVEAGLMPLHAGALAVAAELGGDALAWALNGGEDFELLFTCDPGEVGLLAELVAEAAGGLAVTQVGRLGPGPGVALVQDGRERDITMGGWDHFREDST